MKAHDKSPVFPENVYADVSITENGDYRISFSEADVLDGYIVHEYEVLIEDENKNEIYKNNFVATYYIVDDESTESFTVGQDILEAGKTYTLTVAEESAYHFYSEPVKVTFTVPKK